MRHWIALGTVLIAACGHGAYRSASAEFIDNEGRSVGRATLYESREGVLIRYRVEGLAPGPHALHIHETGACHAGANFTEAGGHFNPFGRQHGMNNPNGPHAGDLPNIEVGPDGIAAGQVVAPRVTLGPGENSLFKPGGTCLMIHAAADDMVSDPAGNAGARVACGLIHP